MDKKIIIGTIVLTIFIIAIAVVFLSRSRQKTSLEKVLGVKIQAQETTFDFGNISYSGGNVTHPFLIKNIGDKELQIANLKTSCECTTVYLQTSKEKGPEFGMPGHGLARPDWIGKLAPGEEGQLMVVFDPTAHGPSGIGPFSRLVSLESNDPDNPYMELTIKGQVIK